MLEKHMTNEKILVIVFSNILHSKIITQRRLAGFKNFFRPLIVEKLLDTPKMIVGTEWLIEAFDCDERALRELSVLQRVFARVTGDLGLKTLGAPHWHKFGGEGGVTGLLMLTESHLACHTYPEYQTATFNLYCCRTRPEWDWEANLRQMLGAGKVKITKIERGADESAFRIPQSKTVFGGEV
jgi:S-adenosylmethionine decarboxylase